MNPFMNADDLDDIIDELENVKTRIEECASTIEQLTRGTTHEHWADAYLINGLREYSRDTQGNRYNQTIDNLIDAFREDADGDDDDDDNDPPAIGSEEYIDGVNRYWKNDIGFGVCAECGAPYQKVGVAPCECAELKERAEHADDIDIETFAAVDDEREFLGGVATAFGLPQSSVDKYIKDMNTPPISDEQLADERRERIEDMDDPRQDDVYDEHDDDDE